MQSCRSEDYFSFQSRRLVLAVCFIADELNWMLFSVQVRGPAVAEVTLAVGVTWSEEGYVQPEGPLETRAESLPRAHPPQKQIPRSETLQYEQQPSTHQWTGSVHMKSLIWMSHTNCSTVFVLLFIKTAPVSWSHCTPRSLPRLAQTVKTQW